MYLECDEKGCSMNVLQRDRSFVPNLGHAPEALPLSNFNDFFFPKDMGSEKLFQVVQEALSRNKIVIICGSIDTKLTACSHTRNT